MFDVAIIGSGFGGSLCAAILARQGLKVLLVDRGRHPRFAIGESSTPIADMVLGDLARQYNLPEVLPLTKFGTWRETYPELMCGCKRGFSYFQHRPDTGFSTSEFHSHELLVAASASAATADTHWLRSDVDQFLFHLAAAVGASVYEDCELRCEQSADNWRLRGTSSRGPLNVACRFLVDATGPGGFLAKQLGLTDQSAELTTSAELPLYAGSRAIYAHFSDVLPWSEVLEELGISQADYPFCCDDAALHHVLAEGWMWQLRFQNNVVSAGFMLDAGAYPLDAAVPIEVEWKRILQRYPSISRQFREAQIVAPEHGLQRTGRLQRLTRSVVGTNWVLLPSTAGFIDPLHSTGIAHTLCGLERLIPCLLEEDVLLRANGLAAYQQVVVQELIWINQLVSLCYRCRSHPRLFHAACMLYFSAVVTYERSRTGLGLRRPFLLAQPEIQQSARLVGQLLNQCLAARSSLADGVLVDLECQIAAMLPVIPGVKLSDPQARNMYYHTAAGKG